MTDAAPRLLIVCTANQCRSPLAAAILTSQLEARGIPATVTSVGTDATGAPPTPGTVLAARRLGLDLSAHLSAALDVEVVRDADLVLTMERRHVQDTVVAVPAAFARTFTFKELVRRGDVVGPRSHDEELSSWLMRAGAGRQAADVLGSSTTDDVADPTTNRMIDHDVLATELQDLSQRLLALAWPR